MTETTTGFRFASAVTDELRTGEAIDEVVDEVAGRLGDDADLVVLFASPDHADAMDLLYRKIDRKLHPRIVLGASAEGVLGVGRELQRGPGLSIIAAKLSGASLHPFHLNASGWSTMLHPPAVLRETMGVDPTNTKAIMLLADPFSTPIMQLLSALGEAMPDTLAAGGMASAAKQAGDNRLLIDGVVHTQGAVGLAIGGHVDIDMTVSHGCRPIGQPWVITRSKRHIIFELGGRSSLKILGETLASLNEMDRRLVQTRGLLVGRVINEYQDGFDRGDFLIRNVAGIDEDNGYFAVNDPNVRVGQTIQFHVRDQRAATEDLTIMLERQKKRGPGAGGLLFTCNGRGSHLFDTPDPDARMIRNALDDMPLAGFFAAGEIGPVGGRTFLHGHTASLLVFRPVS